MKILYRRCAALDIHEKRISVCARMVRGNKVEVEESVFDTFTEDLEQLHAWLSQRRIRRVAMESTGVYWRPVWNILEATGSYELLLLNPQHVKALPGHKTDRVDAARIAELLQYGLVRPSFVPPRPVRELRDLVRQRVHVVRDRNRVQSDPPHSGDGQHQGVLRAGESDHGNLSIHPRRTRHHAMHQA